MAFPREQNADTVTAKIHWEGSRKGPSRSLNHLCPSRKQLPPLLELFQQTNERYIT